MVITPSPSTLENLLFSGVKGVGKTALLIDEG
jgi:DNA replication protein DnaC